MWQVLVAAAAAAGSGILAKKFVSPNDSIKTPTSDCKQKNLESAETKCSPSQGSVFESDDTFKERSQGKRETLNDDAAIFRFSCPERASKEFRKNTRSGFRLLKKNGGPKRGNKNVAKEGSLADQAGNGTGKRISISRKKRRIVKHGVGKCEPSVSKDNSFGWGVGVGIMYMMSAGSSEISRLNSAMDQTVKTVKELKAEILRRKNLHYMNTIPVAESEVETNKNFVERSCNDPLFTRVTAKSKDTIEAFSSTLTDEGEYVSTHIDNQHPEVLEMLLLEAELASELQKLPWCATESSSSEGKTDMLVADEVAKEQPSEDIENENSYQYNGVLPDELNEKLCHLLVEQQESQIMELEAELNHAHTKLHQKEAELQTLKDCVKCFTEFSLENVSDEEGEDRGEDVKTIIADAIEEKEPMVGMKRSIGYQSYICS